jgi:hypothetical protein
MDKDAKYETVQFDDHDDRSSTEVEESLIGDQDKRCRHCFARQELERNKTEREKRRRRERWSFISGVVNTVLLLANVGLLVNELTRQPRVNTWDFGGDLTGVSPSCGCPQDKRWIDRAHADWPSQSPSRSRHSHPTTRASTPPTTHPSSSQTRRSTTGTS